MKQDAKLHQLILNPRTDLDMGIETGRKIYVYQVERTRSVDTTQLNDGDGTKIENKNKITFANRDEIK
ncbi:hypothetical protein Q2Y29_003013 [Vibrio alginolyticus]|nr:hypothetical protein [Vibrio alginolyticus]